MSLVRYDFVCRVAGALVLLAASFGAHAQEATTAGQPSAPYPTLQNLSIEWPIAGDADADGVVSVRFRKTGAAAWRRGMPLRRVPAGTNTDVGRSWTNRHSGSLFDLEPATRYEIELTLDDLDGGSTIRTIEATTRPVPAAASDATVKPATPGSLASVLAGAAAGDIVELQPGAYAGFSVERDGTAGRPLVIRGTPGAVVTGSIELLNRSHVMLANLTVVGRIRFNGSSHVSIVGCNVTASGFNGYAIVTFLRAENAYIADNTLAGLTTWAEGSLGVNGPDGEGIVVTGPGHVIVRNRVRGFRDGISLLEDASAIDQYSIDIADNVVSEAGDDGIEADFCQHNCRIVRNRLTNVFIALSSQPGLGGPTYFIRNAAYNVVHVPFKLYRGSVGDVVLHNTIVKHGDAFNLVPGRPVSRAYFRNNLMIGGAPGTFGGYASGSGRVIDASTIDAASSLDYDGYGMAIPAFTGRLGAPSFNGIEQLRQLTTESHARVVGLDAFAAPVAYPALPMTIYAAPALALAAGSAALDAGEPIPNVNDGWSGAAPDLGAFERAQAGGAEPTLFVDGFD